LQLNRSKEDETLSGAITLQLMLHACTHCVQSKRSKATAEVHSVTSTSEVAKKNPLLEYRAGNESEGKSDKRDHHPRKYLLVGSSLKNCFFQVEEAVNITL